MITQTTPIIFASSLFHQINLDCCSHHCDFSAHTLRKMRSTCACVLGRRASASSVTGIMSHWTQLMTTITKFRHSFTLQMQSTVTLLCGTAMTYLLKGFCLTLSFGMMRFLKLSVFLETVYSQKYWDSKLQTYMCNVIKGRQHNDILNIVMT